MAVYGIIGAMDVEVNEITSNLCSNSTVIRDTISGINFDKFTRDKNTIVVAKCGPGKVNSAVCAEIMITFYGVEAIISTGVAGGYKGEADVGDIVISNKSVQFDVDTSAVGDEVGFVSGVNVKYFESSPLLKAFVNSRFIPFKLLWSKQPNLTILKNIKIGTVATSDKYIDDEEFVADLHKEFGAISFDMETASIAQVCYMNNTPFVSCRVITDNCSGSEYNVNLDNLALAFSKFMLYTINALPSTLGATIY